VYVRRELAIIQFCATFARNGFINNVVVVVVVVVLVVDLYRALRIVSNVLCVLLRREQVSR